MAPRLLSLRHTSSDDLASPRSRRRFSFWLGVILMALSFGIYPAYLVVPFLPISRWAKGEAAVGMLVVSWGTFFVGSVLAGKEGVAYLKRRFSWRRGSTG